MPTKTVKVAISLPREEYRQVEKVRKRFRLSRSAVIAEALRCWVASGHEQKKIRAYVAGYRRSPETVREQNTFESLAAEVLADEEWEG